MEKLINEEFLDEKSIQVEMAIHFNFGGFEMLLELIDTRGGTFNIYKKENVVNHMFQTGYNDVTNKPTIAWEKGIPEDIDIRIATDVMVARVCRMLRENGFDRKVFKQG